jgi:hypothetical protein
MGFTNVHTFFFSAVQTMNNARLNLKNIEKDAMFEGLNDNEKGNYGGKNQTAFSHWLRVSQSGF